MSHNDPAALRTIRTPGTSEKLHYQKSGLAPLRKSIEKVLEIFYEISHKLGFTLDELS